MIRIFGLIASLALFAAPAGGFADAEKQRALDVEFLIKKHSKPFLRNKNERKAYRAIVKLESKDGFYMVGEDDPAFGISQMKVSAVKTAATYWKLKIPASDDKIAWKLMKDKSFAIKMGAAYFGYLLEKQDRDLEKAVRSYNVGLEGEKLPENDELANKYLKKVKKRIKEYEEEISLRSKEAAKAS